MARKLTAQKVQECLGVWLKCQSDSETARLCEVDVRTVRSHRKLGQWERLARKVNKKVETKLVRQAAKSKANEIDIVEAMIERLARLVSNKDWILYLDGKDVVPALDKVVRLNRFLHGEVDSANEQRITREGAQEILAELDFEGTGKLLDAIERRSESASAAARDTAKPDARLDSGEPGAPDPPKRKNGVQRKAPRANRNVKK